MRDFEVIAPMLVALSMSIGAVCIFVWGVLSGALSETDQAAVNFLRKELGHDGSGGRDDRSAS